MNYNGKSRGSSSSSLKTFLCVLCAVAILNEYVIYFIQSRRWPSFPLADRDSLSSKKQVVLIVADPQIQGYQDEPPFPVGTLARWDIDRYLRKTFSYAYEYCQPDVVLFLGDLFDEGSKASPREYNATLDRFNDIFHHTHYTKTIYIPGDNDIGGEGRDIATRRKAHRFMDHFGNVTDIIQFAFVDYLKMNLVPYGMTGDKVKIAEFLKQRRTAPVSILLNHETLLPHPKHFVYPVTRRLRPKLILSAHWHKAQLFTCKDCLADNEYSWAVRQFDLSDMDSYLDLDLRDQDYLCEIAVPTCSYRMGEINMGYGVAIIGDDLKIQYTVLWLPRRYTMLLGYLIVIFIYVIMLCVSKCTGRRR